MFLSFLIQLDTLVESVLTPRALDMCLRYIWPQREPVYKPLTKSLLYVAASSLPYHISGYTLRTQSLTHAMKDAGVSLSVQTRPGYPWDRIDRFVEDVSEKNYIEGINYHHVRKPTRFRPILLYSLQGSNIIVNKAKEQRTAIIHAASNHVNALPALIAARRLGIPFHYEMRGLWELTRASRQPGFERSAGYRLGLALEAFVARHSDHVYVISNALGEFIQEKLGIDANRMSLLPNCINQELIRLTTEVDIEPMTIGYAGSLIGYEGLDTLLEAIALLHRNGKNIQLRIVGDGEERIALETQMHKLGLENLVQFSGSLPPDRARALMQRCAILCIPRKSDDVCKIVPPLKLVEALALGKAVVVPDLPVFRDELGEDGPALFFQSGNVKDLARVIADAFNDIPELYKLGKRARLYAVNNRSWQNFLKPC